MTKDGVHSTSHQPGGFTTVEVLTVIAILMILAAMAIPNLPDWASKQRLKSVVRDLVTHFQYARLEAVKRGSDIAFNFHPDVGASKGSYIIFVDNGEEGTTEPGNRVQDEGEETIQYVEMPDDVNLDKTTFAENEKNIEAFAYNARGFPVDSGFTDDEGVVTVSNDEWCYQVVLQKTSGGLKLEGPQPKATCLE
jgi:Tfp pilus assembly protein FimT